MKVQGHCPMGCGETLMLGAGGHVTCGYLSCSAPTAVDDILADRETDHVVEIREHDFTVQHPLRERLDGDLFECDIHGKLTALDGPPCKPGRYRVRVDEKRGSGLSFYRLDRAE